MQNSQEIASLLDGFYGTERYYYNDLSKHNKMVYTDGVKAMAKVCEANWLIDAISSYQSECKKDDMLFGFQKWTLKVKDRKGILICERDVNDIAFTQEFDFTDFPLDEISFFVEQGYTSLDGIEQPVMVLMLMTEH